MKKIALLLALLLMLPLAALAEASGTYQDAHLLYQEGKHAEAIALWETLADEGDADSLYALGLIYTGLLEFEQPVDPEKALALFSRGAELGDGDCMYALGFYYRQGLFTGEADDAAGLEWYRKAAAAGHDEAAYAAGTILYSGVINGEQNFPAALELFLRGAELGNAKAAYFAGRMYYYDDHATGAPDYEKAYQYLTQCLAEEHTYTGKAYCILGMMYRDGQYVQQDVQKAFEYFTLSADTGYAYAQHELASGYKSGLFCGGTPDEDQALAHYLQAEQLGQTCVPDHVEALINAGQLSQESLTLAAEVGYSSAMIALAEGWCSGAFSGNINFATALDWYLKADAAGHETASHSVIDLYYHGVTLDNGTVLFPADHAAMLAYLEEKHAAGTQDAYLLSWLGWLLCGYSDQNVCEADYPRALEVFTKAADLGSGYAMWHIGSLYDHALIGTGDPDAAARHWYEKAVAAGYTDAQVDLDALPAAE